MATVSRVRPSPIAGRWYSGNPAHLAQQVDAYLQEAVLPPLQGEVIGVIAPHAGHRYSGRTAGHAFRAVMGEPVDLVAVLSPMHGYYPASFITSAHQAYATPLGEVEIDKAAVAALDETLRAGDSAGLSAVPFDEEHSLEIELPFLQRALPGPFRLLPLMLRTLQPDDAQALGQALARVLRKQRALIVASTDLSHFYPEPVAQQLDAEMLKQFGEFSPEGAIRAERTGRGFACGVSAVAAALWAARELGATRVEILHHSTSAQETGDASSVVGYGAAAILKPA